MTRCLSPLALWFLLSPVVSSGATAGGSEPQGFVVCSWYADTPEDQGKWVGQTASGEPYDVTTMTCAHKTLPFGTWARLTETEDDGSTKSVVVKTNDRGPYVKGREFDLTPKAFERLVPLGKGLVKVKATILYQPKRSIYYRKKVTR